VKKLVWIFFSLIIILLITFHNKLIEKYVIYKLSNWVEKDIVFDEFIFKYPNSINIKGINILNSNPVYYDNIFESELLSIRIDLKSYLFSKLVVINDLKIDKPTFFLELIAKKNDSGEDVRNIEKAIFDDNIGVAKKINENLPDKIWPVKKRDINFLILKSSIYNAKAFIKISSLKGSSKINLSNFRFQRIGNQKGYQHYKDVLKIIFFDIFARETDPAKKKILKEVYKL